MARVSDWIDMDGKLSEVVQNRVRKILVQQRMVPTPTGPFFVTSQDEQRARALAALQACAEIASEVERRADDAAFRAGQHRASYAEIGAARGISRQAARQAVLRHQQRIREEQQRRRAPVEDDGEWEYLHRRAQRDREERWPPRAGRSRAPAGFREVVLVDGPVAGRAERVPTGEDAFPFVDQYRVFGRQHQRYARYAPTFATSNQYRCTGEYFIRWS